MTNFQQRMYTNWYRDQEYLNGRPEKRWKKTKTHLVINLKINSFGITPFAF